MGSRAVQISQCSYFGVTGNYSGKVLSGGKAKFFQVGTSTAQAVYTAADKSGSTVTEVDLDSAGMFDTELYFDGNLKIEIYDADNVKQREFLDNTYQIDSFPLNTIVSASDYEDGSLDASTINAAITAIGSDKRTLILKSGTWTIDANVTVPANIQLELAAGAVASVSTGITLTINGDFKAPVMKVFTLNGTGSVTFGEGYIQKYHPEWFGFSQSETGANNATYLQDCIDSITAGTIKFSSGTYSIDSEISVTDKINMVGDGINQTILDYSSSTGTFTNISGIYVSGSLGSALPSFSSSISKGDDTITFSSNPSLSLGDVLIIYDSTDSSFNAARTVYRSGEFVKVAQISGNTITTSQPMYDSYTSGGSVNIYKVTPTTNIFKDFQVKVKNGVIGIKVAYGEDVLIENFKADNSNIAGIEIRQSYNTRINNFVFDWYTTSIGNNYGLMIANSQKFICTNSTMRSSRHGLSMGGGDYVGCVPVRDVIVSNCHVGTLNNTAGGVLALDNHGNGEHIIYENNIIHGGFNIAGDHITFVGNQVHQSNGGQLIHASECHGFNYKISGNDFFVYENITTSNIGAIDFGGNSNCGTIKNDSQLDFTDNNIHSLASNLANGVFYFYNFTRSASEIINLNISNNTVFCPNSSGQFQNDITVRNATGDYINKIKINGNKLTQSAIKCVTCNVEYLTIDNNFITDSGTYGIYKTENGTPNFTQCYISIKNNHVYNSEYTGIYVDGGSGGSVAELVECDFNLSINNGQTSSGSSALNNSFFLYYLDQCFFTNNRLGDNQGTATQTRLYTAGVITDFYIWDNQNIDIANLTSISETSITNKNTSAALV